MKTNPIFTIPWDNETYSCRPSGQWQDRNFSLSAELRHEMSDADHVMKIFQSNVEGELKYFCKINWEMFEKQWSAESSASKLTEFFNMQVEAKINFSAVNLLAENFISREVKEHVVPSSKQVCPPFILNKIFILLQSAQRPLLLSGRHRCLLIKILVW